MNINEPNDSKEKTLTVDEEQKKLNKKCGDKGSCSVLDQARNHFIIATEQHLINYVEGYTSNVNDKNNQVEIYDNVLCQMGNKVIGNITGEMFILTCKICNTKDKYDLHFKPENIRQICGFFGCNRSEVIKHNFLDHLHKKQMYDNELMMNISIDFLKTMILKVGGYRLDVNLRKQICNLHCKLCKCNLTIFLYP